MSRVVLTGAAGPLGRRVAARLVGHDDVDLLALDVTPAPDAPVPVLALGPTADLKRHLEGADVLVHLGSSLGPVLDGTGASGVDLELTRRLFAAAGDAGVTHLVVLSTAMVYGAWPDNPVPLTEDAPLRPNAELAFAVQKAEVERLAGEWRDAHPGTTVALLRPVLAVSEETGGWLASSSWSPRAVQAGDEEPPVQVVHLDDLAAAVDVARAQRLDGPCNVAPDGWLPPERRDELAGPTPRVRLSVRAARRVEALRHRVGLNPTPPEVLAYTRYPWVVSADRLRAAGWEPAWTNEEAFVAGHPPSPLDGLSAKRKQELSLAVTGVLLAGLAVGVAVVVRRLRRRAVELLEG